MTDRKGQRLPRHVARVLGAVLVCCFRVGNAAAEAPQEVLLDPCETDAGWELDIGREFPDAEGALGTEASDDRRCLRVDFDFAKGGNYLGALRSGEIPEAAELRFFFAGSGFGRGMVRVRDATEQEFLAGFKQAGAGWTEVRLPLTAETFARHWGGKNDGNIHWPLRRLLIAANAPGRGQFLLRDVSIVTADAASRWQMSITVPQPGQIAFAEDPPPTVTIAARNCVSAPAAAEVRYAIVRDDGLRVLSEQHPAQFAKWERKEFLLALPSSEPGHYLVSAEIALGTNIVARSEGGIGIVHRPIHLDRDDPESFFGLHVNDPAAAARIGVKWTRVFRQWWWVEGVKGRYYWPDEKQIDAARAMHMRVLLTLDAGPPSWAKKELIAGGQAPWPFPDALLAAYERYIREAARHYRDKVDVFEIQNEPDLSCWRHENLAFDVGMETFTRLAKTAAAAIRAEAPGRPIAGVDVSGGDYDYGLQFSRAALARVGGLFDIFTGHPYASPRYFGEGLRPLLPHENREADKLRESQQMIAALGGKQRVWIGEKGWGLDVREPSHGPHSLAFADCVAQALATARSVPGIERYFWFLQQGCNEGGCEYGLWRGSPRQPLPAAVAYATTARFLDHATPHRPLRLPGGLLGFGFESEDPARGVVALWATDENFDLPAKWPQGTRACGLMGRECGLAPLRVTASPVFLTAPTAQLDTLCAAIEQQPPVPTLPVRVESAYLVSTRQLAARVLNRQPRALSLALRVGGKTSTPQTIAAGQSAEVVFDLADSVRALGWKTVPAEFLDAGRLVASKSLVLNLRRCPRRTVKPGEPATSLGKPSTKLSDRWQVLPPDPTVGWDGTNDLSAGVWWSHDTTNFYFTALVTDDIHYAPFSGPADIWNADSLVLAFDGGNDAGTAPGYDANDTEIACIAADSGAKLFMTHPESKPLNIACTARREKSATLYQLAIPWKLLRITPSPGRVFSFNFVLNDNDGAGRAYWMGPRPGIAEAKRPELFMDVYLDE